jgi:hypothetical protein
MRTAISVVLAILLAACAPLPSISGGNTLDQRADQLMAWIAANTHYPVVAIPQIRVVESLPKTRFNYGGRRLIAGYDYDHQILYLTQGWRAHSPVDAGTLLHELLHHAQVASGIGPSCIRERELEAYATELRYLRETHSKDWNWSPGLMKTLLALHCD